MHSAETVHTVQKQCALSLLSPAAEPKKIKIKTKGRKRENAKVAILIRIQSDT